MMGAKSQIPVAKGVDHSSRGNVVFLVLGFCFVSLFGFIYFPIIDDKSISQYDEYYTLERSAGILRTGELFTVYSNNEPVFKKPPLQYWFTAAFLQFFDDQEVALRLYSFTCGLLTLLALAALVYGVSPTHVYVFPAAIILIASSELFWKHALSAMLDSGAVLFFTLSVSFFLIALRRPVFWYAVAFALLLEALQKAPVSFVVIIICTIGLKIWSKDQLVQSSLDSTHRKISVILSICLVLFFPVVQFFKYGYRFLQIAYQQEMLQRFTPSIESNNNFIWLDWLIEDNALVWILCLTASIALPFLYKYTEYLILTTIALILILAFTFASGKIYDRYILYLFPLLSVALVLVLARSSALKAIPVFIAIFLAALSGGIFISTDRLIPDSTQAQYVPMLTSFAEQLQPDEVPVYCAWNSVGDRKVFPGARSYYASKGSKFEAMQSPDKLPEKSGSRFYRGLCTDKEVADLRSHLCSIDVIAIEHGLVHWRSSGELCQRE